MPKTGVFDAAEYLDSPEMIAEYLTDAFETDDEVFIAKAIGTVARAQGMSAVADSAGVSRENLYRALRGNTRPEFETIRKVLGRSGFNSWRSRAWRDHGVNTVMAWQAVDKCPAPTVTDALMVSMPDRGPQQHDCLHYSLDAARTAHWDR